MFDTYINGMVLSSRYEINSLRLRRHELIFRSLPSNTIKLISDSTR